MEDPHDMKLLKRLLCIIGLHQFDYSDRGYVGYYRCTRCGNYHQP